MQHKQLIKRLLLSVICITLLTLTVNLITYTPTAKELDSACTLESHQAYNTFDADVSIW